MTEPARLSPTFARATCEVLETALAPIVARALLDRAVTSSAWGRVPDELHDFRAFVSGPLRSELTRVLDSSEIAFVEERLARVLGMATVDGLVPTGNAHQSGSHPKVRERRDTLPAPASSPPEAVVSIPRSPLPPRMPVSGVTMRSPRLAPTAREMPRAASVPSCVLLVTRNVELTASTSAELGGRCLVTVLASPADLARAATRSGDRVVVVIDAIDPSIDIGTFVGLLPILPVDTRVVLCGTDARARAHLAAQFPVTRSWLPCAEGRTPASYALSSR